MGNLVFASTDPERNARLVVARKQFRAIIGDLRRQQSPDLAAWATLRGEINALLSERGFERKGWRMHGRKRDHHSLHVADVERPKKRRM